MNNIFQAALFFGICLAGDYISASLPFPFPGSVIAMVILFILLITKAVKAKKISSISTFLLDNMAFCFIPPTVAIVNYFEIIKNVWWQFILICCITTILTFFATAYTVKGVMYLMNKGGKDND
ncbi:MAG: CidA/LrgA family protein [Ruminococcaceae bacterium]|nr:CidA/LrgA family protein [Oscillospiraceae bacterium]